MAEKDVVMVSAVGDVAAFFHDPWSAFVHVAPVLREADIAFGQNERHYSNRRDLRPQGGFTELTSPENAEALAMCGFDVMSFASNHCMDLGPEVMIETVEVLRRLGIAVIGVGRNIEEARRPAIIERKGTRIAFLAYSSVLRPGYEATSSRPGCAPMRAWTLYNQVDYQPGTPPQILTFPYKQDLEAVAEDVRAAKAAADVAIVSFHWGIHFVHAAIATYQKEVAHAAIDAGADAILGHHAHLPKGIEVYRGKPIFYSMGNFAFDLPVEEYEYWYEHLDHAPVLAKLWGHRLQPGWDNYNYPPESRKSMIVRLDIEEKRVRRPRLLPVLINPKAQPEIVSPNSGDFEEYVQYIREISEAEELGTEYLVQDGEIVVVI